MTNSEFVAPGGVRIDATAKNPEALVATAPWQKHQMPAYHLKGHNGNGITLVNIGVGPFNAKTITDHLAVLRPQCWIMVGHSGGCAIPSGLEIMSWPTLICVMAGCLIMI